MQERMETNATQIIIYHMRKFVKFRKEQREAEFKAMKDASPKRKKTT